MQLERFYPNQCSVALHQAHAEGLCNCIRYSHGIHRDETRCIRSFFSIDYSVIYHEALLWYFYKFICIVFHFHFQLAEKTRHAYVCLKKKVKVTKLSVTQYFYINYYYYTVVTREGHFYFSETMHFLI